MLINILAITIVYRAGTGITFFSMCQMAPSISFQWDISNFNGPFDNLNAPKDKKNEIWNLNAYFDDVRGFNNGALLHVSTYMYMESESNLRFKEVVRLS